MTRNAYGCAFAVKATLVPPILKTNPRLAESWRALRQEVHVRDVSDKERLFVYLSQFCQVRYCIFVTAPSSSATVMHLAMFRGLGNLLSGPSPC